MDEVPQSLITRPAPGLSALIVDMSETIETFNPAHLNRSDTISSTLTVGKPVVSSSSKTTKLANSYQRIDFEPLYTDLKALIGHNWGVYHDALTRLLRGMCPNIKNWGCLMFPHRLKGDPLTSYFVPTGELSSTEFGNLTDVFLLASPAIEHAHNCLICAIIHNTTRDIPDVGPAAWVSAATDKAASATALKPGAASDAAEQRLKVEVMALLPRDRRRLKGVTADKAEEDASLSRRHGYEDYFQAGKIRVPDSVPASAGGLNKTNWDLEIRKRYTQPLFSETLEFPDAATIFARMVPICYEESVAAASSMPCAELVSIATESFVKNFLGSVFNRIRVNGPKYENGAGGGVFTGGYKRQLDREEDDFRRGKVQKGRESGLLPVEGQEAGAKRPIGMADLNLAASVGRGLWNGMPLIGSRVSESALEDELEEWRKEREGELRAVVGINGTIENGEDIAMDTDDDDYGWEGVGSAEREALGSLLEDCLSIRA